MLHILKLGRSLYKFKFTEGGVLFSRKFNTATPITSEIIYRMPLSNLP